MIFTQYYLECLSQASYLIGDESTGRAVVVDPRRDINEYVQDAEAAGLTARGWTRTLRLARTIADLESAVKVDVQHLAEAVSYRCFDRGWK